MGRSWLNSNKFPKICSCTELLITLSPQTPTKTFFGTGYLLLLFVLTSVHLKSQNRFEFSIDNSSSLSSFGSEYLDAESGLPQNEIIDMHFTEEGFLWLLTYSGLCRYDGREVKHFKEIENQRIIKIFTPGLYHMPDGRISCFFNINTQVNISENGHDLQLVPYDSNYRYFLARSEYAQLEMAPPVGHPVITFDNGEGYGFGKRGAIYFTSQGNHTLNQYQYSSYNSQNLFKLDNRIFTINEKGQLLEFIKTRVDTLLQSPFFESAKNDNLIWKKHQKVAYYFTGKKLYELSLNKNGLHAKLLIDNLPKDDYTSVLVRDNGQNFYLGTKRNGLLQVSKPSIIEIINPDECARHISYAIAEIGQDTIMNTAGVLYVGDSATCEQLISWPLYDRFILYNKATENITGSGLDANILFLSKDLKVINKITFPNFKGPMFIALAIELKGSTLIYVSNNKIYELDSNKLTEIYGIDKSLGRPAQFKYYKDSIFFLAHAHGLLKIDLQNKVNTEIETFQNTEVRAINFYDNKIWVSTGDNGIFIGDGKKWHKFNPQHYPELITSHEIRFENNFVFISTNRGLFNFQLADIYTSIRDSNYVIQGYSFTAIDGLSSKEFNGSCQPASLKLRSGNLAFPTLKGLVKIQSRQFKN